MRERSAHPWRAAVAWALLVALAYAPTLRHGFVNWDDDVFILNNAVLQAPDALRRIWSTIELPRDFPNYPLTFTSFWLEQRLWGLTPTGYHATNILLHAVNTGLVYALALTLGASAWAAGLTAALFGLHPMQVESVAWISERKNLLSASFALLSMLAYVRHRDRQRRGAYALSLLAFAAALLSKTSVVVLPLSLLLLDRWRDGRWTRRAVLRVAPMIALAAIAGLATLNVEAAPATTAWTQRPLLALACLGFYTRTLVLPWRLTPIYPASEVPVEMWWLPLLGLAAVVFMMARRAADGRVGWGFAHFGIMLLPVLGLRSYGFNEYSLVADRNVYFAAIGFFLAVACLAHSWRVQRERLVDALAAAVIVCFVLVTELQIPVWRNSLTLWTKVLRDHPQATVAHVNLGLALIEAGRLPEAAAHLETALHQQPDDAEAHMNLALVAYRRGDLALAEQHCREALRVKPYAADFHKNLGVLLRARGDIAGAAREQEEARRLAQ